MAGAQCFANLPPLTSDKRLRTVLISWMLAPLPISWLLICCNSGISNSDNSNSAEPPPERRNSTVSSGVRFSVNSKARFVPRKEFSSKMGCPASMLSKFPSAPRLWSYLVSTKPEWIWLPSISNAADAMVHAALPTEISTIFPCSSMDARQFFTAVSGSAHWMAWV